MVMTKKLLIISDRTPKLVVIAQNIRKTCVLVSVLKSTTPLLITSTNAVLRLLSRLEL